MAEHQNGAASWVDFSARLLVLEGLLADFYFAALLTVPDPETELEQMRAVTLKWIRFGVSMPAHATTADADFGTRAQTRAIEIANRFFGDLRQRLEQQP